MPDVAIVVSEQQDLSRRELAGTLAHELSRQGIPAEPVLGAFPPARADLVTLLIDPLGYVAAEGHDALPAEAALRRTVFVCPDRAPAGGEEDPEVELLARGGAVFALDRRDVSVLHRAGIPARLMRPGYSDALDHYDAAAERAIDIMVLGERTPHRAEQLRRAAPVLARHNCLISLWEPGEHPRPGPGYPGEDRWPLLARTKVLINLHDGDDSRLEWSAVLDAIHAGAVVVSEHSTGLAPLEPGAHLLVAAADALPYVADHLLADPDWLARLREQAYERLSTWIPYALPVSILRAAIVELVGEALPEEPEVSVSLTPDPAPAAAEPALAAAEPALAAAESAPAAAASPAGAPGDPPSSAAVTLADSPAWAAHPGPRVSAVCVIDDKDAARAAATLDSLAAVRMRAFELIVVHASGDAAERAATDWCGAHPRLAWRRIGVRGPVDLGSARRAGALVARAPYVLVLQPGQALYPRALDVLSGTLEGVTGAELAYPILASAGEEGQSPLLNTAGEPVRAPLLVRTETLLAAPDGRDETLVAAAAEVALVPQILGRVS